MFRLTAFIKFVKVYKNSNLISSKHLIMDSKNLNTIAIFGSTGLQGGSVVDALIADKKFKVRAITRNVNSEIAKKLQSKGAEVVSGDLDNKASLVTALKDVYGVFLVTDFFQSIDPKKEFEQGKNAVDAAKENHVQHLVFSALEHVKEPTGWACPHFDSKAAVADYIKTTGLPYTFVHYSFYMENLIKMPAKKDANGDYVLEIPMGNVAMDMVPVGECGECIHQIFLHKDTYVSKTIGLSSDKKTLEEYCQVLKKHIPGTNFIGSKMTPKEYAKLPFPVADDIASMFNFYQVGTFVRDIKMTQKLNPHISNFDQWVKNNVNQIKKASGIESNNEIINHF